MTENTRDTFKMQVSMGSLAAWMFSQYYVYNCAIWVFLSKRERFSVLGPSSPPGIVYSIMTQILSVVVEHKLS